MDSSIKTGLANCCPYLVGGVLLATGQKRFLCIRLNQYVIIEENKVKNICLKEDFKQCKGVNYG